MINNKVVRLRHRPQGRVKETDLEVCQEPILPISDGQLLVRNCIISLDPTHRIWMSDKPQYMDPMELNDVMRALTIGMVQESHCPEQFPVGTYVIGLGGVCEYYVGIPGVNVFGIVNTNNHGLPLSANLSILSGLIGLTAWYGIRKILQVTKEDVVVVSGAAGAVGSVAGQLAKLSGATVIGIAGGSAKCQKLTHELGFDVAIDYKSQNVDQELKKVAPNGITCYFDNVGGDITDAVLLNFRNHGRFALCGSISEYEDNWTGCKNFNMILMRRIMVQGFISGDHLAEYFAECMVELGDLVKQGKIKYYEDNRKVGVEEYVHIVNDLYDGKNTGKLMMTIHEE
jgi:hypothetical protein